MLLFNIEDSEIFDAVDEKDIKLIKKKINKKNVNLILQNGESLLFHSIGTDNVEMVKLLLSLGADPNQLMTKSSPIHEACEMGNIEIVKLMVNHPTTDINLQIPMFYNFTPLHSTSAEEEDRSKVIELLLSHPDINPNLLCDGQETPLITAIWNSGAIENVKELLKSKVVIDGINHQNKFGITALGYTISKKQEEMACLLLDTLAINPNLQSNGSKTIALKILAWNQEIFAKLLQLYSNVDLLLESKHGNSIFKYVIDHKMEETFELVSNYIKLWRKSSEMKNIFSKSIKEKEEEIGEKKKQVEELNKELKELEGTKDDLMIGSSKLDGIMKRKITDVSVDEKDMTCPITNELMKDPVMAADGHNYERSAIEHWFARKLTSPLTNEQIVSKALYPNHQLKSTITSYIENKIK